jgi:signal recognition particle subunit SRP68
VEATISTDGTKYKRDWFAYNGGSVTKDPKGHKKPLFFDIALNYVELDMDRLLERAGKAPAAPVPAPVPVAAPKPRPAQPQAVKAESTQEKKPVGQQKAKVEETQARPETPQPSAPSKGGLSTLLGGWWGRS